METNIKELAAILKKLTPQQTAELSTELDITQDDVAVAKRLPTAQELRTFLTKLGAPIHNKGFEYIVQATLVALDNPQVLSGVTTSLYPEVAKRVGSTASRVERAIRHELDCIWDGGYTDREMAFDKLGFAVATSASAGRPTNGEFIAALHNHFRLD